MDLEIEKKKTRTQPKTQLTAQSTLFPRGPSFSPPSPCAQPNPACSFPLSRSDPSLPRSPIPARWPRVPPFPAFGPPPRAQRRERSPSLTAPRPTSGSTSPRRAHPTDTAGPLVSRASSRPRSARRVPTCRPLSAPARHAPLLPLAVTDRPATPSSFFSLAEQQPRPSRRDLRRASRPGPTRRGPQRPFFKTPRDPCALLPSAAPPRTLGRHAAQLRCEETPAPPWHRLPAAPQPPQSRALAPP